MDQANNQSNMNPPSPQPTPPSHPPHIMVIILVIVVAAFASLSTYFVLQSKTPPQIPPDLPPVVPSITTTTPTNSANKTDDWTALIDSKNGYSYNYPSSLFVKLICPENVIALTSRTSFPSEKDEVVMPTCARDGKYEVEVVVHSNELLVLPSSNETYQVVKTEVTINGVKTDKYTSTLNSGVVGPYPSWFSQIFINHNGKVYEIYFSWKEEEKIFDQILTTFRFLDSNTLSISNWKTYSNSQFNFSFKYPDTWFNKEIPDTDPEYPLNLYFNDSQMIDEVNSKISVMIIKTTIEKFKAGLNYSDAGYSSKAQFSTFVLNGNQITKAVVSTSEFGEKNEDSYILLIPLSNSTILEFHSKVSEQKYIDEIVSTFKLI